MKLQYKNFTFEMEWLSYSLTEDKKVVIQNPDRIIVKVNEQKFTLYDYLKQLIDGGN